MYSRRSTHVFNTLTVFWPLLKLKTTFYTKPSPCVTLVPIGYLDRSVHSAGVTSSLRIRPGTLVKSIWGILWYVVPIWLLASLF